MNSIFTRVSIRKYQDRPVEKEKTFHFFKADHMTDLPGYSYIGSVSL